MAWEVHRTALSDSAQVFRPAERNLEGRKCSARSSDKFSGATLGRCRQMVLQKPTVGLASFPLRPTRCFWLLRHSTECSLSLVANVSSRFIYDFFSRPSCQANSTSRQRETLGHSSAHQGLNISSLDGCTLRKWEERSCSQGVKPKERGKEGKKNLLCFLFCPFLFCLQTLQSHTALTSHLEPTSNCAAPPFNSLILSTFKSVATVKMSLQPRHARAQEWRKWYYIKWKVRKWICILI